jgi:hypothetical protein
MNVTQLYGRLNHFNLFLDLKPIYADIMQPAYPNGQGRNRKQSALDCLRTGHGTGPHVGMNVTQLYRRLNYFNLFMDFKLIYAHIIQPAYPNGQGGNRKRSTPNVPRRSNFVYLTGQTPRQEYKVKCPPHCAKKANLILCTPSPVTNPGTKPEFINLATLPL